MLHLLSHVKQEVPSWPQAHLKCTDVEVTGDAGYLSDL